ncbi:MAG: uracil-xanthine permease [Bacilli bacterium]|nr:uracil-xanthine permease [Bacilli bacterium]
MNLVYNVKDKPSFGKILIFSLQQLLAILAATIAVPAIVGHDLSPAAALFGAGAGTIVYLLFTRFKSPVFLGSSFAFLGSMSAAFAGAVSMQLGYFGLILGCIFAGLVYVVIALVVKFCGTNWIDKVMPAVVIGPTVAIIGLSLAGNAIGDVKGAGWLGILCGLVTLFVTIICSVFGKKIVKMIPFVIGIGAGYVLATIFTVTGAAELVDFGKFNNMEWYPHFTFLQALKFNEFTYGDFGNMGAYIASIAIAYVPVAFVVFAEHLADHKNLSSIIGNDLTKDPGLSNTLLGDGVGSMVGAFFGGAANTTYGESIATVAISGNASTITIFVTAIMAIVASFIGPFATFLATIPSCVMGGVCIALYGFIAVSGLKMIQKVDLGDNRNLFVVSTILIAGVGGFVLNIGKVTLTAVAVALILGILVNVVCSIGKEKEEPKKSLDQQFNEEIAEENKEESEQ